MKASVSKTFRFEAAHQLPNHDGKCSNLHGHSYKVVVVCEGDVLLRGCTTWNPNHPKAGMVVDFADVKKVWEEELKPLLDHCNLNETLSEFIPQTTAECIAYWICAKFRMAGLPVKRVEVWETETSCASIKSIEIWQRGGAILNDDQSPNRPILASAAGDTEGRAR